MYICWQLLILIMFSLPINSTNFDRMLRRKFGLSISSYWMLRMPSGNFLWIFLNANSIYLYSSRFVGEDMTWIYSACRNECMTSFRTHKLLLTWPFWDCDIGEMTQSKIVAKDEMFVISSPSVLAPNGVKWVASQQYESIEWRDVAIPVTSAYIQRITNE